MTNDNYQTKVQCKTKFPMLTYVKGLHVCSMWHLIYPRSKIALSTNDVTIFWSLLWLSVRVWYGKVTFGKKNFRRFWRCLSLKETKSSLVSIINIPKIINACQDSVKRGKNCTDEWFYFLCGVLMLWVKLCWNVWRAGLHSCAWNGAFG